MRTRSTTTGGFTTLQVRRKHKADGTVLETHNSYSGTQRVKFITDVQTPKFVSLLKCGKFLPLNPVVISTRDETWFPGPVANKKTSAPLDYWSGTYAGWVSAQLLQENPPVNQALLDAAVLAAAANAADAEWDVLTFLAELRSSVDTLASVYSRFNLRTRGMAISARNLARSPRDALRIFRDLWLEARYGIRPLIYDAQDAVKAIGRLGSTYDFSRGTGYNQEDLGDVATAVLLQSTIRYDVTAERTGTRQYRGFAYASFESDWAASFGSDPLVTAWELVPYSFVVDWFVNIGAWVKTLTPSLKGQFLGVGYSVKTTSRVVQEWQGSARGGWDGNNGPYRCEIELQHYERGSTSIPTPPLLPELTIPRFVDLVALALGGRRQVNSILGFKI